jgi:predicted RNA-binding protein YlxR (DUF448 family)
VGGLSEKLGRPRRRPRRCVGCGGEGPKAGLIRIVRSPGGAVSVDPTGKAPGRGAYVCADVECVRLAKRKNSLARALRLPVDAAIYALAEELAIERRESAG